MIKHIHKHIISELGQNTRTDIIFILTTILLNLMSLSINSAIAEPSRTEPTLFVVMLIFVAVVVLINLVAIFGLLKGKQSRSKLLHGLLSMYKDERVEKYYDSSLLANYNTRYNLFILVVVVTGLIAIVIPFVLR